ncbi:MAG: hypothetical protein A3J84_02690 [Ignavibacteria bacterium RIFOXYA2_FULL_37_17]|nr:MAG: hypothetical protein A3J84_02690 [Ignavibacteria bacterium RIFOXYA2_FULL_37_17]
MGFSTLLDILGSTIAGGLLLMILMRMNDASVENNYFYSGERIVQQNLVEVVKLLEFDLRKIGYCNNWQLMPIPSMAITQADSNGITFLTDIVTPSDPYGDGVLDVMHYYLGPTSELTATPNPYDRLLYRVANSQTPAGSNLGLTQFKLTYFDANGDKITSMPASPPFGIAAIQIDISVENTAAYGNDYSADKRIIWRQVRLPARNFTLR